MKIHLRDKDREEIIKILRDSFIETPEVWVFGSRINGSSHDASDLDIVLRSEGLDGLDEKEFLQFKESLRESRIPIVIDAFDWFRIPNEFRENILKNYQVLA
ncbi:MAG: nucleotidyltransferase family protein [Bdellovibrionales bacterium]